MNNIILYMPSGYEIILIMLVIVLLFGGKKIPELMRGLGKGMKEFKKATSSFGDIKQEIDDSVSEIKGTKKSTNNEELPKKE